MTTHINEEQLTGYVLNELDESERAAVEKALRESPELQERLKDLEWVAQSAREAFSEVPEAALTDAQRKAILQEASQAQNTMEGKRSVAVRRSPWRPLRLALPLAAGFLLVLGGLTLTMLTQSNGIRGVKSLDAREMKLAADMQAKSKPQGEYAENRASHPAPTAAAAAPAAAAPAPAAPSPKSEPAKVEAEAMDAQTRERLETLGYLQGGKAKIAKAESPKPEPKAEPEAAQAIRSVAAQTDDFEDIPSRSKTSTIMSTDINGSGQGLPAPGVPSTRSFQPQVGGEAYDKQAENAYRPVAVEPLSTFSIDVDTASYSNIRRFLNQGTMPPPQAVRIEEMVNYFDYVYPQPEGGQPFSVTTEVGACPWKPELRLMRVGLKGREFKQETRPACNLVFLLDVSGSMGEPNKLPLVKRAMQMLLGKLNRADRVAIVTYAGSSGVALDSTPCTEEGLRIASQVIDSLEAGGSTYGSGGLEAAYEVAQKHKDKEGISRVILCTDGDFNVGVTNKEALDTLIKDKAKSGIFLSVFGFGIGNFKDATLESLADKGNGNYGYIDNLSEARKVLVDGIGATLVTIAKDVKIQVEFNPAYVAAYRLIGYENRMLAKEDFNDDTKDAGEIGAGHTVTALYEIVPPGVSAGTPSVDPLKYQQNPPQPKAPDGAQNGELCTVKLRYKEPTGDSSKLISTVVRDDASEIGQKSGDFKFASAVAGFGLLLSQSPYKGLSSYDKVIDWALAGKGNDEYGYRTEFINLVRNAQAMGGK